MHIYTSFILFIWFFVGGLANNNKLRELIVKVHGISDSATVYYIGTDEDFLSEFIKTEVSIPISTFNTDFTEGFEKCTNVIIVFQVPDNGDEESNSYLNLLQNVVEKLQVRKFAIISARSLDILNQYFSIFAENKFTRIFGIIGNTSSYAYLPFAGSNSSVRQLVGKDELPHAMKDLNCFAFRTTVITDIPRAFWYPHKDGKKRIGGRTGQIFQEFLKRYNATFKEISIKKSDEFFFDTIINATLNNEIDISMNTLFRQNSLDYSYPVALEKIVIMVPWNGYLNPVDYFQRPFKPAVWICIGLAVIYIMISKIILNWLTNLKLDIWGSFTEIYLTLLSSSSGKPITSNYRFHLLVLLFGFIFERLYGSYFQSFLTANIKIKQYDTLQDLEDNNVPVLISNFRWEEMKYVLKNEGIDKNFVPTDTIKFIDQFIRMENNSVAYVLEEYRCKFLIGLVSLYGKPLFRTARESISNQHIGFYLAFHSPFKEILNSFIFEIHQTGLFQKWDSEVMNQAKVEGSLKKINMGGFQNTDDETLHTPLTIYHFKFAWRYLAIGLTISTLVFVFEWAYTIAKTWI